MQTKRGILMVLCIVLTLLANAWLWPAAGAAPRIPSSPGDANADGVVDLFDLVIITTAYNPTGPVSDPRADVNGDGVVNLFDLVIVAASFGSSTPPTPTPTPGSVPPPLPPTDSTCPQETYTLQDERVIAHYAIRLWQSVPSSFECLDIVTIDAWAQPRVQIEAVDSLDDLTGSDITGEGHPDVIIHTFTRGAHCCFSTFVYDLGPTITKVLETPESHCPSTFGDLDGDGVSECQTCDDLFAYRYCGYAGSPMPMVILEYGPGQGYVPASPRFAYLYAGDIVAHTLRAQQATLGGMCQDDGTTKCAVLAVVLDYLYAGLPQYAWAELYRLYRCPDVAVFRAEIEQAVYSSPLFTPH